MEDQPIYVDGAPVSPPPPPKKMGRPPAQPPPPPPKIKPLLEQLTEATAALVAKDSRIKIYERQLKNAQYAAMECRKRITIRTRYLREQAAEKVRKDNGVQIIDGYADPKAKARANGAHFFKKVNELRRLAAKANVQLPGEIVS